MSDILIIDDENIQRKNISGFLRSIGYTTDECDGVSRALKNLSEKSYDMVISDMKMKDGSGRDVLDFINKNKISTYFILMTAYATVDDSIYVLKNGGYDYIQKPVNLDDLEKKIENISSIIKIKNENAIMKKDLGLSSEDIVFESKIMKDVINLVEKVATSKAPVMIYGESGTGKEIIARMIHNKSGRKEKMFVPVNCGALNENLLESELFGHEKGSFTGASERKRGRFEIADSGTIFLDEIGDVSLNMQVKLLRVLQEGEFERVGGSARIKTDVRVIGATNKNIDSLVRDGLFREDLYFRLNVVNVGLPPLRERGDDFLILAKYFLDKYSIENGKKIKGLTQKAADKMKNYYFPGNVRELQNIIQRAVILSSKEMIDEDDILLKDALSLSKRSASGLDENVEMLEKNLIKESLEQNNNSIAKSAKHLKITERILRYKMEKYNINR